MFSDKKKWNSKNFAHVCFCALEISTKFWDFAAGMDFGTSYILSKMSQMHDFHPNNSATIIYYRNNYFNNYLTVTEPYIMVAENCLKISVNQVFYNFKLPLLIFQNRVNSDF